MNKIFLFSIFAFLLLAGCASTNPQQSAPQNLSITSVGQTAAQQTPIQQTAPQQNASAGAAQQFQNYTGPFFSFSYPTGMQTDGTVQTDSNGKPYGGVLVYGAQGQILLLWRAYAPENASLEPRVPVLNLMTFEKNGDPLKLLNNATNIDTVNGHTFLIEGFGNATDLLTRIVAETAFENEQNGTHLYCYALEYYEPDLDRMVSVRISGTAPENVTMMRNQFFRTFMFSNWKHIVQSN